MKYKAGERRRALEYEKALLDFGKTIRLLKSQLNNVVKVIHTSFMMALHSLQVNHTTVLCYLQS